MRKTRDLIFDILVLLSDAVAIIAAYVVAYGIRAKLVDKPLAYPYGFINYIESIIYFLPLWILIFALAGLYKNNRSQKRLDQFGQILIATASGTMLLILVDFYRTTPLFPSKGISILGFGLSFFFVLIGRELLMALRKSLIRRGKWVKRVAIVGPDNKVSSRVREALIAEGGQTVAVVSNTPWSHKVRQFKSIDSFVKQIDHIGIDELVQTNPNLNHDEELELIRTCHSRRINYRLVPNIIGLATAHQELTAIDGVPVIDIKPTPLDGWGRILKRSFDTASSLLGLIILSPLFLVIAIIIKVKDPGPVFYRQRRLSRDGETIRIIKFRTMKREYSGVPDKQAFAKLGRPELYDEFIKQKKLPDDPRLSKIGRWLRKTSLDELPQLLNVALGQLSLVGPRPMLKDELERYGQENLSSILSLKCGVTGLWQVSGRSDIGFASRVKLDLYYVENWSLWLDLKIILKTIWVVIKGKGAY